MAVALLAAATLWVVVDRWWPLLPLGYGPRWPWLALPLCPLLVGGRWPGRLLAATLTAVIVLWGLLGFRLSVFPARGDPDAPRLRVVTFNAAVHADAVAAVLAWAGARDVDVMVVVECPKHDQPTLAGYRQARAGELCTWSRIGETPVIREAPRDPRVIGWSGTIATILLPGSGMPPLGVVHLRSVRNELDEFLDLSELLRQADSMEARRSKRIAGSRHASAWMRQLPERPQVVVGDFNLVVESPRFRTDWLTHWHDAFEAIGNGTGHTWHSRWYGLRIDHVLHDDGWRPVELAIAPPMGSDHRAVLVELRRNQPTRR